MSEGQNALSSPDLTDGGRRSPGSGIVLGSQLTACAFNCGCLTQSKHALLVRYFNSFNLDLLVLTEIGQRKFELAGQSGWITSTTPTFRNGGVAMMVSRRLRRAIQCELKISDRILGITLGTPDGNLLLVWAYAPHEGHAVSDYNSFLSTLQTVLDKTSCKRRIIVGDLNANIARNTPGFTGKFSLHHYHSRNDRLLANFSQHNNLVIANSFFKSGRKGTHGHATYRSHKQRNKRSELDLILIDRRW